MEALIDRVSITMAQDGIAAGVAMAAVPAAEGVRLTLGRGAGRHMGQGTVTVEGGNVESRWSNLGEETGGGVEKITRVTMREKLLIGGRGDRGGGNDMAAGRMGGAERVGGGGTPTGIIIMAAKMGAGGGGGMMMVRRRGATVDGKVIVAAIGQAPAAVIELIVVAVSGMLWMLSVVGVMMGRTGTATGITTASIALAGSGAGVGVGTGVVLGPGAVIRIEGGSRICGSDLVTVILFVVKLCSRKECVGGRSD